MGNKQKIYAKQSRPNSVTSWHQVCCWCTTPQVKTLTSSAERGCKILPLLPYSPDLAPSDYYLLPKIKYELRRKWFESNNDVMVAADCSAGTGTWGAFSRPHAEFTACRKERSLPTRIAPKSVMPSGCDPGFGRSVRNQFQWNTELTIATFYYHENHS